MGFKIGELCAEIENRLKKLLINSNVFADIKIIKWLLGYYPIKELVILCYLCIEKLYHLVVRCLNLPALLTAVDVLS